MPIVTADLTWHLSIKTGAAGDTTAQGDANLSLGKYLSTTPAPTSLNALFDLVTAARNAASEVDYRCVFVRNQHATLTATGGELYLDGGDPAGGMVWAIAVDSIAASAIGSASAQAQEATTDTAPGAGVTGLSFSAPTTEGTGLTIGDLAPGYCRAVWIRCAQANTAAVSETITLKATFATLG
jgi:hypothetical protein